MDITEILPSNVEKFDMLILGTPVEGSSPAKALLKKPLLS
jgi:hypothetical protein